MNLDEIKRVLSSMLNKELSDGKKRNIVFWYDEDGEFEEEINELAFENAEIIKLTEGNSFAIKYRMEKQEPNSNFLIYSPKAKPVPRDNWLLDIQKFSSEFSTDKTSVIMRDLGVKDVALRGVFKKYAKFFDNKERYRKFASYNIQDYTEKKLDIAVLSVLCKLPVSDLEMVVKAILIEELNNNNKFYSSINSFGDLDAFWSLVEKVYGYSFAEKSLEKLMIMFMITHLSYNFEEKMPKTWEGYISPRKSDVVILMDHFMNHGAESKYFDSLSDIAAGKLNLTEYISKWNTEIFIHCDTFKAFDEAIIERIKESLLSGIGEFEKYRKIINNRRTSHWFEQLSEEYSCLYYAMEMFRMEKELNKSIKGKGALGLIESYTKEYYLLDTFYRKFYYAFDKLEVQESFGTLTEKVENTYTNWYMNELSIKWSEAIEELKGDWLIPGLVQQQDYYKNYILPHIKNDERVFVIISDALRYEAAKEFSNTLNTERKGSTEIFYMQGSVPSYTKLGMASLLPHKSIEITDKGDILVDSINTQGTENRESVLQNYCTDSVAVSFNDIKDMKRPEYKETFEGKKLIYIYHNSIDARGDHAATEREVFDAVEKAFEDLRILIKNLINNLSATNIYTTADHGFIYRRTPLAESDKTPREMIDSIEAKRRFILTDSDKGIEGTLTFSMDYLVGKDTNLKVIVPRGTNCFKVQGMGSNYVHGGAALQEIIIPVIKFKNDRSKSDQLEVKKVNVKPTNISRKITNIITYLEFFQTEKVEDKRVARRLKLYFADEQGSRISNENIIIADSRSLKPEERTYREKFTLKNMSYDKSVKYYLILEDEEETVEKIYERIPFNIDLAFVNDFGF